MKPRVITVNDSFQNYTYPLTEPEGKNFASVFTPELTPAQMLELGVFGANYFEGEYDELPKEWLKNAKIADHHDPAQNYFKVDASQSRREWLRKGWIYEEDPRGWFQWYCRYYMGRRILEEDARQIRRWKNMRRHSAQLERYCAPGDITCPSTSATGTTSLGVRYKKNIISSEQRRALEESLWDFPGAPRSLTRLGGSTHALTSTLWGCHSV